MKNWNRGVMLLFRQDLAVTVDYAGKNPFG